MLRVTILITLFSSVANFCYFVKYSDMIPPPMKPGEFRINWKKISYNDAQEQCKDYGGKLANIDTKEKWDEVNKCHVEVNERALELWTAAKVYIGQWQWENGKKLTGEMCSSDEVRPNGRLLFSRRSVSTGCFKPTYNKNDINGCLCEYKSK